MSTTEQAPLGLTETLRRTPAGHTLYLALPSPAISSSAAQAGVKVTTAKFLAIHPGTKEVIELTQVTVHETWRDAPTPAQESRTAYPRRTRAVA